jgi:hypothetical protein
LKALFLDESGDHNLSVIDRQYPLFVLGGVIVDLHYAETVVAAELNALKRELFGREDIVLHTADIVRNKNGFERMMEPAFRQRFFDRLNDVMRRLDYQVVACVIRKDAHLARYALDALDPYLFSLNILVERFGMEIGPKPGGIIIAERRDEVLDQQLELAWTNLKIKGTRYLSANDISSRIGQMRLRPKIDNVAGLQLADLVVSPIGRYVLGKPVREDFRIVESKFRRNFKGEHKGFGLVVLPK